MEVRLHVLLMVRILILLLFASSTISVAFVSHRIRIRDNNAQHVRSGHSFRQDGFGAWRRLHREE